MYEWLTGAAPFQGGFDSIARQHLQDQPPPLRAWNASISPLVEEVVLTTLAKDPKDRFATMSALAAAFERACYPYGPAKLPPSLPGTPPTPPANAGGAFPTPPNRMPVASPTPIPLGINTPATPTPTPVYTPTPAPTPAITPPVPLITPTTPPVLSTPPPSTGHKRLAPGIRVLLACLVVVLLAGGSITALGLAGKGPLAFLGSSPVATPTRLPFGTITEFNTPSFGGHATGITAGPDGNLWFT
jgi:serine/threonine protein kinase